MRRLHWYELEQLTNNARVRSHTRVFHMADGDRPGRIVHFGVFEADLQTGELHKNGVKVPLQGQPFQVCAILLQHSGELVTREELRRKVWPEDTFVDFDHALNTAITKIRIALGDEADNPRFVETLPRRGYRFIGSLDKPNPQAPSPMAPRGRLKSRIRPWMLAMASLLIAATAILLFVSRKAVPALKAQPRLVPLTTYTGREYEPALAPDGNRVAFAWSGPDVPIGRTASIYVKQIGEEHALRLTSVPGAIDFGPDWSPDGAYIVFGRFTAPTAAPGTVEEGIYMVPAMGGTERRVHSTNWTVSPIVDSRVVWASDGKTIAFSDRPVGQSHYAVFALDVATLSARQITFPPESSQGDIHVGFSPDARMLAFLRETKDGVDVYVIPVAGGSERRLTFDNRDLAGQRSVWLVGLTYTSDGHDIILGGNGLWRIHATGQAKRAEPVRGLGSTAFNPYIRGNRLVYGAPNRDANVYLLPLRNEIHAGEPTKLIASTFVDADAQLSPDGRHVVFSSDRTGAGEIWKANSDGSNPMQLTFLSGYSGNPRWSGSGREIVFSAAPQGNADLFVISADGGPPRQITTDSSNEGAPNYSRDGRWIYFASDRGGSWNVWKMPAEGGPATQVTCNGGFFASESPDGQYLYYAKAPDAPGLWRVPLSGGSEEKVLDSPPPGFWGYWAVGANGIYYIDEAGPRARIRFRDFRTHRDSVVKVMSNAAWIGSAGMSLSPNGSAMAFGQLDQFTSDLMLVEDFY
jgi:Tol biopolymer transport system component/DNA-binding winged helix-turn-helix (wHTH) protein